MTPDRERNLERICQAALDRPIADRDAFLAQACGGDDTLLRDVKSLLAQAAAAASFLETPALAAAAHAMATGPALAVGQQIGPYTIVSALGSGGMGEVYRARDATLGREVALKVLPALFTSDSERLVRFEREARLLASLNHPNIATIHGVERIDGLHALVLEVVEGQALDERLRSGAGLTVPEALTIARQIGEALDAAHEKGVIHRDLKPANIKIRPDGVVKVLDFGLAKAAVRDQSVADASQAPTLTAGPTREGAIFGTAAYMSPEQARGEVVDKRTDIWAFGCVLYEMLTGHATFAAPSTSETLSEVLKTAPNWDRLPPDTPESVNRLLRRCLTKDRTRRLSDIRDARLDLDEAPADVATDVRLASHARRFRRVVWAMTTLLVAVATALGLVWRSMTRSALPAPQVRFEIVAPPTFYPDTLAFSPDGRKVVYGGTAADGSSQLWQHALDAAAAQPLAGTEGGQRAFWSPDNRSIGFFADASLKRMDLETGTVLKLADAPGAGEGTWSANGIILFTTFGGSGVLRISDQGGSPIKVESATGMNPRSPHFLPDGRHFVYRAGPEPLGIRLARLDGSEGQRLVDGTWAEYAPSGHLLYIRDGALYAQRFDPARLVLTGSPSLVSEGVIAASVGSNGGLVFRAGAKGGAEGNAELVWLDRSGKNLGSLADTGGTPAISPDGHRVAFVRRDAGGGPPDVWTIDLARNMFSNLTVSPWANNSPLWSPDSTSIVFTSPRNGKPFALHERPAEGGGAERLLLQEERPVVPNDWSADRRFIIYRTDKRNTSSLDFDLWVLSLEEKRTFPVLQDTFAEREAQFSPDGRWFAYQSNESGRYEIYVRPFPDAGRTRIPISGDGGAQVRWPRGGRELFYLRSDDMLMAVPMQADPAGRTIKAESPVPLFRVNGAFAQGVGVQTYAASKDGTKFLISRTPEVTAPITVVLNWKPRE